MPDPFTEFLSGKRYAVPLNYQEQINLIAEFMRQGIQPVREEKQCQPKPP